MILTTFFFQPSEIAENTAAYIARRLPDYLDKRAYVVVNGAVPETTALLGKVSSLQEDIPYVHRLLYLHL